MLDTNEEIGSGRHILHEEQEDNDSADSSSRSTKLHQNLKPLTVEVRISWNVITVQCTKIGQKMFCLQKECVKFISQLSYS